MPNAEGVVTKGTAVFVERIVCEPYVGGREPLQFSHKGCRRLEVVRMPPFTYRGDISTGEYSLSIAEYAKHTPERDVRGGALSDHVDDDLGAIDRPSDNDDEMAEEVAAKRQRTGRRLDAAHESIEEPRPAARSGRSRARGRGRGPGSGRGRGGNTASSGRPHHRQSAAVEERILRHLSKAIDRLEAQRVKRSESALTRVIKRLYQFNVVTSLAQMDRITLFNTVAEQDLNFDVIVALDDDNFEAWVKDLLQQLGLGVATN